MNPSSILFIVVINHSPVHYDKTKHFRNIYNHFIRFQYCPTNDLMCATTSPDNTSRFETLCSLKLSAERPLVTKTEVWIKNENSVAPKTRTRDYCAHLPVRPSFTKCGYSCEHLSFAKFGCFRRSVVLKTIKDWTKAIGWVESFFADFSSFLILETSTSI